MGLERTEARPIRGEKDFWRLRELLIETHAITPPGFNWEIRRWDGAYFYGESPGWRSPSWGRSTLWQTSEGQAVAAIHPEGEGEAFLELHPDYRHLEEEMVVRAERDLAVASGEGGARQLEIYVYEYDAPRRRLLEERGYEKRTAGGVFRQLRLGRQAIPKSELAEGYRLRTTRTTEDDDGPRIAALLNAAFGRTFHQAGEWQTFSRMAPSYRNDLDLVAEAPDGALAAYVSLTFDEANRYALFEPVCTHPDHRRRDLARALMLEGLQRVRDLGATLVSVDTGDQVAANRLYEAMGFTEAYKGYSWRKVLTATG